MSSETNEVIAPDASGHVADDHFHVVDESSANWVVKKINEARAYRLRVEQWAAAEIRRAERDEQFFLSRYGAELEAWTRLQVDRRQRRRKSLWLPAGTVGFRIERPKLTVVNESSLRIWCHEHLPAAVKVVERVLISMVREHTARTGELVIGTEIRSGGEKFFIK